MASTDPIPVAAAVILRDRRVLIARRPEGSHLALRWEFPGGKTRIGETMEECLHREIEEELATSVEILDLWKVVTHSYPEKTVRIAFFRCRLTGPEPQARGCPELTWVGADQLSGYCFPDADAQVITDLKAMLRRPSEPRFD
jgi:mutator protein MutT